MDAPRGVRKQTGKLALGCAFDLHSWGFGVIHVVTAKLHSQGEKKMSTLMPEGKVAAAAPAKGKKGKQAKKAPVAPRRAHAAPTKGKSARKATLAKKAPTGRVPADAPKMARPGSKTAKILDLLTRPGGVTSQQLIKATGWLPHSVRGFLSGTVGKKMGLTLTSSKDDDGTRTYSVEA
jgi:hypothetical protein